MNNKQTGTPKLPYGTRIVRLCGGPSALAREIGEKRETVRYWAAAGTIPDKHKVIVLHGARNLGVYLTVSDFWPGDWPGDWTEGDADAGAAIAAHQAG